MTRIIATLVFSLIFSSLSLSALAETYPINSAHTFAYFEVDHLGLSKIRGRFDSTSGSITIDKDKTKGSVEVTIDTRSISTGVPKLDEQLRGAEFFDAQKYPAITFKSTNATFADEELVEVTGDLTMHGVTKQISLQVNSFSCIQHPAMKKTACGAMAETTIRRSDFGIKTGLPGTGDDVAIRISMEAYAQ